MTAIVTAVERPVPERLATLGVRHVVVMYAGTIVVGWALKRPPKQVVTRLNAELLASGIGRSRDTTRAAIRAGAASAERV
jgi:xanthine/uracil permease